MLDGYCNTPIQKAQREVGGNQLFYKRDDLFPFFMGGNKARKALYFYNEILDGNYDVVVTYGSFSSNHCRAIAIASSQLQKECIIVSPEENLKKTSNSKIVELLEAKTMITPLNKVSDFISSTIIGLEKQEKKVYFIQGGGHGNLGTKAYADAYMEIDEYEKKEGIYFDYIFFASGTGTTQAGLVVGQILSNNVNSKIIGISIGRDLERGKSVILNSVDEYLKSINIKKEYSDKVIFLSDYLCGGYGKYNDGIKKAVSDNLKYEGIQMDTTYTGKAFWGMTEYLTKNRIVDKNVLFVHTGGNPLFFDYLNEAVL